MRKVSWLVLVGLLIQLLNPGWVAATDIDQQTVRLMVELADWDEEILDKQDYRKSLREVKRLTERAPKKYVADGQLRRATDLRRFRVIEVATNEADGVINKLEREPAVLEVRPVKIYEQAVVEVNDPESVEQWHLQDLNLPTAWESTTGSDQTVIAILDGGVDERHEDLTGKIWKNSEEVAGNGIDDDGNGRVDDVSGWDFVRNQPAGLVINSHATHVAGIAAGQTNNGIGIAGVDWQAKIMNVRVLGSGGLGLEDAIIEGINYAVAEGADVINMSLVGSRSAALNAAIENAYAQGVVVVAAAGNFGRDTARSPVYPVCSDAGGVNLVLGVAAYDEDSEPARFSNYGRCVDVSAPGDDIVSSKANGRYGQMSGTSMAAPVVAGLAGLYLSRNPEAEPARVIEAITRGVDFINANDPEEASEWTIKYKQQVRADLVVEQVANSGEDTSSSENSEESGNESSGGGDSGGGGGDSGGGGGGGEESSESAESQPKQPAQPRIHPKANLALLGRVKDTFRYVFGRVPTNPERAYWTNRIKRADKRTYEELLGAMRWQKARGLTAGSVKVGKVAGARSGTGLVGSINRIHRSAYGRNPSLSEHRYWLGRVVSGDKTNEVALLGAMVWHRLAGVNH